jgi:hypothetical protein
LTKLFQKPTYSDTAIPEVIGSHFDLPAANRLLEATRSHSNIPEASSLTEATSSHFNIPKDTDNMEGAGMRTATPEAGRT